MKNRGNNTPAQTFPQMVEAGTEQKRQSKLYKAESAQFVDERLSALVGKTAAELATAAEAKPVSLADTELVKERTILLYMAKMGQGKPQLQRLFLHTKIMIPQVLCKYLCLALMTQ